MTFFRLLLKVEDLNIAIGKQRLERQNIWALGNPTFLWILMTPGCIRHVDIHFRKSVSLRKWLSCLTEASSVVLLQGVLRETSYKASRYKTGPAWDPCPSGTAFQARVWICLKYHQMLDIRKMSRSSSDWSWVKNINVAGCVQQQFVQC